MSGQGTDRRRVFRGSPRTHPRPRKIITQVIVFLLLGAIINVAVAWGCARWRDPPILASRSSAVEGNDVWTVTTAECPGIAVVSTIVAADDPAAAARNLMQAIREARES